MKPDIQFPTPCECCGVVITGARFFVYGIGTVDQECMVLLARADIWLIHTDGIADRMVLHASHRNNSRRRTPEGGGTL